MEADKRIIRKKTRADELEDIDFKVWGQMDEQTSDETWDLVMLQLSDQVERQVRDLIWALVEAQVNGEVT